MTHLPRTLSAVAAAALLAACPVAAASAGARPTHDHAGHGRQHVTHHVVNHQHATKAHQHATKAHQHGKPADHLAGARRGSSHAIAAQLKAISALLQHASTLTGPDAEALLGALSTDAAAAQSDLDAVAAATSVRDLQALRAAANVTRHTAQVQFQVVVAGDAAAEQANNLSVEVGTLMAQLADQPSTPESAAAMNALEADAGALAAVPGQVAEAVAGVLGLVPNGPRSTLHDAADSAFAALAAVEPVLAQAEADVLTVKAAFGF